MTNLSHNPIFKKVFFDKKIFEKFKKMLNFSVFFLLIIFHQGLMESLMESLSILLLKNIVKVTNNTTYFEKFCTIISEFSKAIHLLWKGCLIDLETMSHFCTNNLGKTFKLFLL